MQHGMYEDTFVYIFIVSCYRFINSIRILQYGLMVMCAEMFVPIVGAMGAMILFNLMTSSQDI